MSATLCIDGLSLATSADDLRRLGEGYGDVLKAWVVTSPTGGSIRFGYLEFATWNAARALRRDLKARQSNLRASVAVRQALTVSRKTEKLPESSREALHKSKEAKRLRSILQHDIPPSRWSINIEQPLPALSCGPSFASQASVSRQEGPLMGVLLCVAHLPSNLSSADLRQVTEAHAPVSKCWVVHRPGIDSFGFVDVPTSAEVHALVKGLAGVVLNSKPVSVTIVDTF